MRDAADQLRLHGRKDPKADHLQLLQKWLRDESKGSWLMILDNADDASFLVETPATVDEVQPWQRLIDLIPSCNYGSVIITTRSKSEALKLVYEDEIVHVLPMAEVEAGALLKSKIGHPTPDNRRLVRALDCMPLAIAQAAAYIRERDSRCSVQQYCEDIEQNRRWRISLLRRHVPLPDRDAAASNSVMLTWQISFEHIYSTRRSAAELLSLMSLCDRHAIPEVLLRRDNSDEYDERGVAVVSSSAFEEDIVILRQFSFVSETAGSRSWEMHRLVQDATQVWLEERGRLERVRDRFVHRLYMTCPSRRFEDWSLWRLLIPHVMSAIDQRPAKGNAQIEWAWVMYKGVWFANEQGAYDSALTMAELSRRVLLEHLGEGDRATLSSMALVGLTYQKQGRWKEAEQLQVEVMSKSQKALGPNHHTTLSRMADLATTYRQQERWKEAEQLQVKVMSRNQTTLGPNHHATLSSMVDLATTYRQQGRRKEAEQLHVKVMEITLATLGPSHPSTLSSVGNVASAYRDQGRLKDAEKLQVRVIEIRQAMLGPEHLDTLESIADLAKTYRDQGRWEEAGALHGKAVDGYNKLLGPQHPRTVSERSKLGYMLLRKGGLTQETLVLCRWAKGIVR